MANARSIAHVLALSVLPIVGLSACVVSPHSRTAAESLNPVTLNGYAGSAGETITIQAVDQNTGKLVTLSNTVKSAMSGTSYKTSGGTPYTLYPWSYPAGVLDTHFWSPQAIVPGLAAGQGHLELFAAAGGSNFDTFSDAAAKSVSSAISSGTDPATAGNTYSDGKSIVLFDQTGLGSGAGAPWTSVQGMISNSNSPYYSPVAWSVGYYTVEGNKKIYGLICTPTTSGSYPVVIFNHGGTDRGNVDLGGTDLGNGGGLTGTVTASGWTSQPYVATTLTAAGFTIFPDSLGQCVDWAKRGWIFATSSYRGEQVHITSASPAFPASSTWTSDGNVELCSGEVTDVLALADLLANHAGSISVGSAGQQVKLSTNGKMLMYGYSHGGCITYRAVEQGAPVSAFSVTEGFADFRLTYMNVFNNAAPAHNAALAALGSGAGNPSAANPADGFYYPDANGVMGYNWRSAHYFASRGDLSIQKFKTMPILIFHGDVDVVAGNGGPALNPVFLDEAAELSHDIGATNIFVGPNGSIAPSSEPCISGAVGAAFPDPNNPPPLAACPMSFTAMNTGDPCLSASPTGAFTLCKVLLLPLSPQQLHYLVVYHNMNHVNGGLAIKETFNRFAEQNFLRQPGCDGLEIDCASD